ncbi:hypothetical protein HAX54_012847 [Datura stramonium]|uniref:Uncharacterized protein n=1 Tax=Datura stramonium TaxID=4076 RepID=A0ABS8TMA2_DATST|nr:hypothetical protein [Datura stramonium]
MQLRGEVSGGVDKGEEERVCGAAVHWPEKQKRREERNGYCRWWKKEEVSVATRFAGEIRQWRHDAGRGERDEG